MQQDALHKKNAFEKMSSDVIRDSCLHFVKKKKYELV